ncbi:SUZ domain-containing protein 1 [Chelonus insularis]|uniref:SUZ domain-containing protein 1 n=1 Tax=Chelonus insularis TaxID=460826 RepID=UPI00158AB7B5|nr:SUZ domain-containing protein 1 [Chelonus insularis]XP_034949089.1 SUZ domain-containing protein 1 [Chelonus insularis]XP_034949090.1 SUZ domain-containing protein 1 [Chelonus insularis]XP_034949091.1 SUZ domain-containing protein 1 [Chelonus insularis]XP_034949092.1 SUZ domain-containing protein 1 [Chelonus insularis]
MSTADEVFETWEEMEASGILDRNLNALQLNALDSLEERPTTKVIGNSNTNGRMIILGEDSVRSQYVPPKPTVKILKRPQGESRGNGDGQITNGDKPKQPIKSLKQREQEYAEARKRILGEEKSPEEKSSHEINKIHQKFINDQSASSSPTQSNNSQNRVLRMPLGPDGTRGFNVRR